nr:MAG TPA: hypothetical protein [Caudoviricetes sp.]
MKHLISQVLLLCLKIGQMMRPKTVSRWWMVTHL